MSQVVFADSVYWVALVWPKDVYHRQARQWHGRLSDDNRRIVTTDAVLLETLNHLSAPPARPAAVKLFHSIHVDPRITVLPVSGLLLREAFDLFAARSDKWWSLVDCASFVVMKDRHLDEALTSDHHFQQAGFKALLRESAP